MQLNLSMTLFLLPLLVACKAPKDGNTLNSSSEKQHTKDDFKNKAKPYIYSPESISKSACRIAGVVTDVQKDKNNSLILQVTSFLGEGASFNSYRPIKGDNVEVTGIQKVDYHLGDTLKIEIQTLPKQPNTAIQKVGLIKILEL